ALHREVLEETGWRIALIRRIGAFRRFTYMPDYDRWAEKLCAIYLARPILRLGPPSEPGHTAVWLPVRAALTALGNQGDRAMLAQVLRRY
ncbi:MAG: NUDIX domain-containing protein, partial [Rhodobacterales bacterium]|nr:NUDIX domain-containing protein [Rhodobacterales bacterium]